MIFEVKGAVIAENNFGGGCPVATLRVIGREGGKLAKTGAK